MFSSNQYTVLNWKSSVVWLNYNLKINKIDDIQNNYFKYKCNHNPKIETGNYKGFSAV